MQSKRRRGLRQARFWVNTATGIARVKICAGQRFEWASGRLRTDEGWREVGDVFEFDGYEVFREWFCDGRDCDGRLTHSGADAFTYREYAGGRTICFIDDECRTFPAWKMTEPVQVYDETAQAANY